MVDLKVGYVLKNGAVVDYFVITPHATTVLAYWEGNYHPWVTWRLDEKGNAHLGNYFKDHEDAAKNLKERI